MNERVPLPRELRTILHYASERAKCSIALMAFSSLRPQTLGNVQGTDGLRVKDLPEMRMEGRSVTFTNSPTTVVVKPSLSKAGHRYFTFLSSEGCECVQAYRKGGANGEELTESPTIAVTLGFERKGKSPGTGSRF